MYQISVIIPIYNVEKYICDCLNSVVQIKLFEECEIILIDDGSEDHSVEIAQKLADKYENIVLYHYRNSGLSTARNHGIEHATGKYLFFLDSDDYLKLDYLYKLYQEAETFNCEIVFAGFSKVEEDGTNERKIIRPVLNQNQTISGCQYLNLRMNTGDWHNEVWCALYQREFLEINHLKFDENIKLYEDILFTNTALLYAKKIRSIPVYGYMYRHHRKSLVQDGVKIRDITASIEVLKQFVHIYQQLDKCKRRALGRVIFEHISMILYYIGLTKTSQEKDYYQVLQSPEILNILKASIQTPKEGMKYIIFRYAIWLYYPLVRKKECNETRPLISIIVPIYNAEQDLERCLKSIAKQKYSNIEVILIDDGSTDCSIEICQQFITSDPRFHLFHQENRGVSAARNTGLDKIHGEYLLFIDSDDSVDRDFITTLWQTMQKADVDMVICDYQQDCRQTDERDMKHYTVPPGRYSRKAYIRQLARCPGAHYFGVLWNKIYKIDLIRDKGLRFQLQLSLGEDFAFNMEYLSLIKHIQIIPDQLYMYTWRSPLSLTHCKKDINKQLNVRVLLYQAYKNLFRREHLERRWWYKLHYYLFKTYFEELKELGKDEEKYRQLFYHTYIRNQGIGKREFQLFYLLKKVKHIFHKR